MLLVHSYAVVQVRYPLALACDPRRLSSVPSVVKAKLLHFKIDDIELSDPVGAGVDSQRLFRPTPTLNSLATSNKKLLVAECIATRNKCIAVSSQFFTSEQEATTRSDALSY